MEYFRFCFVITTYGDTVFRGGRTDFGLVLLTMVQILCRYLQKFLLQTKNAYG